MNPQLLARRRLASNARRSRARCGWTQEQAAEAIGCSVQHVRRVEGGVVNTSIDMMARMAASYGVDIRHLLAPAGPLRRRAAGRPRKRAV